jgi:hypothetical protein
MHVVLMLPLRLECMLKQKWSQESEQPTESLRSHGRVLRYKLLEKTVRKRMRRLAMRRPGVDVNVMRN